MTLMTRLAAAVAVLLPLSYFSVGSPVSLAAGPMLSAPSSLTTTVAKGDYGIDVFSYDSQLNLPSTIPTLETLGMGMQQFPNDNQWSWVTNSFRTGGQGAVSLNDWGRILESTGNTGLFIFNYDENPTFTGGGDAQDATNLTEYITQHHLPITAIVIGSEEYGPWDFSANLNPSDSAAYYAQSVVQIAQAIHTVDPSMKVGVSFSLGTGSYSRSWNQTVLRTDAPYINFLSVHDYPISSTVSDSELLSEIPNYISSAMNYVDEEISANVPAPLAKNIQTWVTEYNPYGQPGSQSTNAVYGAAMVESAMLWRSHGANKLFIWSYDGQAHAATAGWPVAADASQPFGLFALSGNGMAPELAANTLYPSGQALSQYMSAIGNGGLLRTWITGTFVAGQVSSNAGNTLFLINQSPSPESITIDGQTINAAGASLSTTTLTGPGVSLSSSQIPAPQAVNSATAYHQAPIIQSLGTVYDGESVVLHGQHFGTSMKAPAYVQVSQNNVNYGGPGNVYRIAITQWNSTTVTFTIPNGSSGPGLDNGSATVELATDDGVVSNMEPFTVAPAPQLDASVKTGTLRPGSLLTITGSDFGATQGNGYVLISQNGINYGAPGDSYKISVTHWSDNIVSLVIPDGSSGPALTAGPATLLVSNGDGEQSAIIPIMVQK